MFLGGGGFFLLTLLLGSEQVAEELTDAFVFLLVAHAHAVALREVQVVGQLVGGVGEDVEAVLAFRIQLDLDVEVACEVAAAAAPAKAYSAPRSRPIRRPRGSPDPCR